MITDKFKKTIFDKLTNDLSCIELILYNESVWFIDRETKYWHLEFKSSGKLYWRWGFFNNFFKLFSLDQPEYEPLIKEWVEGVLKGEITKTSFCQSNWNGRVEGVLKGGVTKTQIDILDYQDEVEEVLKGGVTTTSYKDLSKRYAVEEILKGGITTTIPNGSTTGTVVEEVLKGGESLPLMSR